jgi:hypothetical protein
MSDTTETATGAPTRNTKVRGRPFQKGHKIGPRFQKGHPFYPPKPVKRQHRAKAIQTIAKKLFREIEEECGGELTIQQRMHAANAARLGALAQYMFDSGNAVNLETHDRLLKRQERELELMNG